MFLLVEQAIANARLALFPPLPPIHCPPVILLLLGIRHFLERVLSNVGDLWSITMGATVMKKVFVSGLAALAIVSATAPALASDHGRTSQRGGADIGPLGQCFDARACDRGYYHAPYGYGLAAGAVVGGAIAASQPWYGYAGYDYGAGYYGYGYASDYGPAPGGAYVQTCTYLGGPKTGNWTCFR
jgi:hypothetical protein